MKCGEEREERRRRRRKKKIQKRKPCHAALLGLALHLCPRAAKFFILFVIVTHLRERALSLSHSCPIRIRTHGIGKGMNVNDMEQNRSVYTTKQTMKWARHGNQNDHWCASHAQWKTNLIHFVCARAPPSALVDARSQIPLPNRNPLGEKREEGRWMDGGAWCSRSSSEQETERRKRPSNILMIVWQTTRTCSWPYVVHRTHNWIIDVIGSWKRHEEWRDRHTAPQTVRLPCAHTTHARASHLEYYCVQFEFDADFDSNCERRKTEKRKRERESRRKETYRNCDCSEQQAVETTTQNNINWLKDWIKR